MTITLRAGNLRAVLAPECGGSIAAFYSEIGGGRRDWLRPATAKSIEQREPLGMSSFPMAPFCNRIRGGAFQFEGREFRVPHALHGLVWRRPWSVRELEQAHVHLSIDDSGANWPSSFKVEQRVTLTAQCLSIVVDVENTGTQRMPVGLGLHPYIPNRPGARLTTSVREAFEVDADLLPTGRLRSFAPVSAAEDGVPVDSLVLDNCFPGWTRRAEVDWPDAARLVIEADAPFDFLSIFVPPTQDFFCLEPVSNAPDWVNCAATADGNMGGSILEAGERLSARCLFLPFMSLG
jgi:aldose 1-epimerase